MLAKQIFLGFFGICAGGIIAAGVYAFMVMVGVFTRLIGKSSTGVHIRLYDTLIVIGGSCGNVVDLYKVKIMTLPQTPVLLTVFWIVLGLFGMGCGIFVGCLVMSLAETLKALPVITRRIRLAVGLQYVILAIALGKVTGSLFYFINNVGGN